MACKINYGGSKDLNPIKTDPRRASNSILPWTFYKFVISQQIFKQIDRHIEEIVAISTI